MNEARPGVVDRQVLIRAAVPGMQPGVVGIDAGMTLTKFVQATADEIILWSRETASGADAVVVADGGEVVATGVTGARLGMQVPNTNTMPVQEIDAAVLGVTALLAGEKRLGDGEFIMALLGTGTAFALVRGEKATHLGGTPLGGGSFGGIARRIAPGPTYAEMIAAASRGDRRRVDAMISDAYPEGIGRIGPNLTAAHLAKEGGSQDDVLAGLLNLHGEGIAQIGASRAIIANVRRLVLAGGFIHGNDLLAESIASMAGLFGVSVEVAPAAGFVGAIGAALAATAPD